MRSSYIKNNYAPLFEYTAEAFLPRMCVELGVLDGYSTLAIAKGLKKARDLEDHVAPLNAYDLWEDYPYKHGDMAEVVDLLNDNGVGDFVNLYKRDAFEVYKEYAEESVCLLHVDLSNTGEILETIVEQWHTRLSMGGMLLFEGGSEERDNVEWMKKFNKKPIKPVIETSETLNKYYIYGTYLAFPSLTVFIRKG